MHLCIGKRRFHRYAYASNWTKFELAAPLKI
jgi:hypothetical protein